MAAVAPLKRALGDDVERTSTLAVGAGSSLHSYARAAGDLMQFHCHGGQPHSAPSAVGAVSPAGVAVEGRPVESRLDLEELARTLEALEEECDPVSLPIARSRAVGIARILLARVQELESGNAASRVDALHPQSAGADGVLRTVPTLTANSR